MVPFVSAGGAGAVGIVASFFFFFSQDEDREQEGLGELWKERKGLNRPRFLRSFLGAVDIVARSRVSFCLGVKEEEKKKAEQERKQKGEQKQKKNRRNNTRREEGRGDDWQKKEGCWEERTNLFLTSSLRSETGERRGV